MNYILSIPDVNIGNLVSMNQRVILTGAKGIYLISNNTYDKIFTFDQSMDTAIVRSVDGKDFLIYVYNRTASATPYLCSDAGGTAYPCSDGSYQCSDILGYYKIYRINRFLHISELESATGVDLSNYNIINNNNPVNDNIVLVELNTADIKILEFDTTQSNGVIETRPINLARQDGSVFYLERIYLYSKGYGSITLTVGNAISNDINETVAINSNNDARILRTAIEVASTAIDYKIMTLTFASTIAIDKIEFQGRFINK